MPKNVVSAWDKTFAKSDKVNHKKVAFKNRYGIVIVADLYTPKNMSGKLPAIAISGPYGAVKEQSSGLHAQTLAERGFVTLAFDPSFTGESGGDVRDISSPDINTEDFSAAVDYLGVQDFVDREKTGILGICGWAGFALNAAISDTRIKAVAVTTMYDMTRVTAKGYNDSVGENERYEAKKALNLQRWTDFEKGEVEYLPSGNIDPKTITEQTPKFVADYALYYKTPRGYHERAINSKEHFWSKTDALARMSDKILTYANELRAPVLVAHGEVAHSRYFSEDAFKELGSKNKELFIVPGASHTDLYDKKIPFDKFEEFFKANLK
ncbi:alpha/beta hydrolase [Campylobacter sp. VBCF_06 NA8]|uniref:alpha/beta hydrolase n=1 Tax=Campylobacter sp. VBCF_06 NA8 TaxID=2983822 RepID=UPI002FDC28A2